MTDLSLEQKLKKIKFTIKDIEINKVKRVGVVSVELTDGVNVWHRPFGLSFEQGRIKWEDFVNEIRKVVKKELETDLIFSVITNKKGKQFDLFL